MVENRALGSLKTVRSQCAESAGKSWLENMALGSLRSVRSQCAGSSSEKVRAVYGWTTGLWGV
jgi:hypothetical protein